MKYNSLCPFLKFETLTLGETKPGDNPIKDLIKYIVQALVDIPEQVEVTEIKGSHVSIFEVRVAKSDMGKVIGKQGRNAKAIRTILSAASATACKGRSVLEIVE